MRRGRQLPGCDGCFTTPGEQPAIRYGSGGAVHVFHRQRSLDSDGTITGVQSGPYLDAPGASTASGPLMHPWTCGGSNQQW
ncbi:RICIN domain-containing protein [Streptomyces sp. NPDC001415]